MLSWSCLFESVRPDIVQTALNYLKQNNALYNNFEININNIPIDLLSLEEIPILREAELDLTNQTDNLEEVENPLDQYRIGANNSALIPTIPCEITEENITVAPGADSDYIFFAHSVTQHLKFKLDCWDA